MQPPQVWGKQPDMERTQLRDVGADEDMAGDGVDEIGPDQNMEVSGAA